MVGIRARTSSTTWTVLASGWRCTARTMARVPLNHEAVRLFSTESSTLATSFKRTGAPSRQAMASSPNAAALGNWALDCKVSCCLGPFSTPKGELELAALMALLSSSTPIPREARASGFNWMRTANFWLP